MTSDSEPRLRAVVETKVEFKGYVLLRRILESAYRRECRAAFLPTEAENEIFRAVARAAQGTLNQGRRNLLLVSPFGTGKTLDLAMIYDIFSSPRNPQAVQGFDRRVREDLLALTSSGPYLVVPVVGTDVSTPLSQAILASFRQILENHPLLKGTHPGDVLNIPLEFEVAVRWLKDVASGELQVLRPRVEDALQRQRTGFTVSALLQSLEKYDPVALETWREVYHQVTTLPPNVYGTATPRDVFESALPRLRERGIVGIVLLIDELSQYLTLNRDQQAAAIKTLDPLVHWIDSTDTCFSVVATQVAPERLDMDEEADYQAWASLKGRFEFIRKDRRQYDRLIASALRRVEGAPVDPRAHPQMQNLYEAHVACFPGLGQDRAAVQQAVRDYYPFHPTVAAAIGAISDRLGQHERSIFQYLDRGTANGFNALIAEAPVYQGANRERLRLVTLDEIYRYLAIDEEKLEGIDDGVARASQRARMAAGDDELAGRILDLITLLAYLDNRANLPTPTKSGIALMLNVSEDEYLDRVLSRFVSEDYFTYTDALGYQLNTGAGPRQVEVQNALRVALADETEPNTGKTVVDFLSRYDALRRELVRKQVPSFPINGSYQETVKSLKLKFERQFVTGKQLVDDARGLSAAAAQSGKILVGAVTADDIRSGLDTKEVIAAAQKLAKAGAIVAIPRSATDALLKPIRRRRAAARVATNPRFFASETAKAEAEEALYQVLSSLQDYFNPGKLEWYTPAQPATSVGFASPQEAVREAARKLTESFPDVIAQQDIFSAGTDTDVMSHLLHGGGPTDLHNMPGRIYQSALEPLGIADIGPKANDSSRRDVRPRMPDRSKPELAGTVAMWDVIAVALPEGKEVAGDSLHTALINLQKPPFCCPQPLVSYLLAAYMGFHKARVKASYETGYRTPQVDEVKALVKSTSNRIAVYLPVRRVLTDAEGDFIMSLAAAVAGVLPRDAAEFDGARFDVHAPEAGLAEIGHDLSLWYREVGSFVVPWIESGTESCKAARAFLAAVQQARSGGTTSLEDADLYTHVLRDSLGVPEYEAPLAVERLIMQLNELDQMRTVLAHAESLAPVSPTVKVAWHAFRDSPLEQDKRKSLEEAVQQTLISVAGEVAAANHEPNAVGMPSGDAGDITTFVPNGARGAVPQTDDTSADSQDRSEETESGLTLSGSTSSARTFVEELLGFADFIQELIQEIQAGEGKIRSLEEVLRAYREHVRQVLTHV